VHLVALTAASHTEIYCRSYIAIPHQKHRQLQQRLQQWSQGVRCHCIAQWANKANVVGEKRYSSTYGRALTIRRHVIPFVATAAASTATAAFQQLSLVPQCNTSLVDNPEFSKDSQLPCSTAPPAPCNLYLWCWPTSVTIATTPLNFFSSYSSVYSSVQWETA
jgi:hypothetical protein